MNKIFLVASYTDAWIEIIPICPELMATIVASYTDAWIEIDSPQK